MSLPVNVKKKKKKHCTEMMGSNLNLTGSISRSQNVQGNNSHGHRLPETRAHTRAHTHTHTHYVVNHFVSPLLLLI